MEKRSERSLPLSVCLSPTAVFHTWAAGTDVCAGVPSPCHAIHGLAVVNGAIGYQIWRRGGTTRPLLTDTCQGINWSYVIFRHPLVYTLKIRRLVLIWWVTAGVLQVDLTQEDGNRIFLTRTGTDFILTKCHHLTKNGSSHHIIILLFISCFFCWIVDHSCEIVRNINS